MNDLRPALTRLHHPLEADRMVLRHRRSHDKDGIRVAEILLRSGRAAASEGSAQTGHRRAMSYTGLVADADHSHPDREELADQIILFDVQRGPAKVSDRGCLHQGFAVAGFLKSALTALPEPVGDHVHRRFLIDFFPLPGVRPAILHFFQSSGMGVQFESVSALGAETPAGNGRLGITFYGDQLSILVIDKLPATNSTIGTNGRRDLGAIVLGTQIARALRHGFRSSAIDASLNLLNE